MIAPYQENVATDTWLVNSHKEQLMSRQKDILPTDRDMSAIIIGAGSIGSMAAYMLASVGVQVSFLDFDRVGLENLYPSFYGWEDEGKRKVLALEDRLQDMLRCDPIGIIHAIEDWNPRTNYTLALLCTDNLETRRVGWDKLFDRVEWLIDARVGGWQASVYAIPADNEQARALHYSRELDQPNTDLPCGMKATAPLTKGWIPGMLGQVVVDINNGKKPPYLQSYDLLNRQLFVVNDLPS